MVTDSIDIDDLLPPANFEEMLQRADEPYSGWVAGTAEGYLADFEPSEGEMQDLRRRLRELVEREAPGGIPTDRPQS